MNNDERNERVLVSEEIDCNVDVGARLRTFGKPDKIKAETTKRIVRELDIIFPEMVDWVTVSVHERATSATAATPVEAILIDHDLVKHRQELRGPLLAWVETHTVILHQGMTGEVILSADDVIDGILDALFDSDE